MIGLALVWAWILLIGILGSIVSLRRERRDRE